MRVPNRIRHVYPTWGRPHVTGGRRGLRGRCWCRPRVEQICPLCSGEPRGEPGGPPCGHCEGKGWVLGFTDDPLWPTVVIHRSPEQIDVDEFAHAVGIYTG